jgi:hypothetical protein
MYTCPDKRQLLSNVPALPHTTGRAFSFVLQCDSILVYKYFLFDIRKI